MFYTFKLVIAKYININTFILNFLTTFYQLYRLLGIVSYDSMLMRWTWVDTGEGSGLAFVNVLHFVSSLFYETIRTRCRLEELSRYIYSLRTGWPWDRLPVAAKFSVAVHTDPQAHTASCTLGTESSAGVRRTESGVDYPLPSSA